MDEHEHEEMLEEEMDVEDLAESNQVLISALIELLIKKGVLTQAEIDAESEAIQDEDDEDDEEEVPAEPQAAPVAPPAQPQAPPAQPQAPPAQPQQPPPSGPSSF